MHRREVPSNVLNTKILLEMELFIKKFSTCSEMYRPNILNCYSFFLRVPQSLRDSMLVLIIGSHQEDKENLSSRGRNGSGDLLQFKHTMYQTLKMLITFYTPAYLGASFHLGGAEVVLQVDNHLVNHVLVQHVSK